MDTEKNNYTFNSSKVASSGCITLIGMAGAGKTTIGRELSSIIGWPQFDSDTLIEATYGSGLQNITESMSKEQFLDIEEIAICSIGIKRAIISTGGSVIYRKSAMEYLSSMGPAIYISVPLPIILERIARKPERGLAIAPGQSIEELYYERAKLYESFATFTIHGGHSAPSVYAQQIAEWLEENE